MGQPAVGQLSIDRIKPRADAENIACADRKFNRLHRLMSTGRHYRVTKHQMVQSSDDRYRPLINLVKEGYIKRYEIGNDGSIAIQAIYGPGDIFPLTLVFKALFNQDIYDGPEIIYYETLSDAEIYSLDTQILVDAIRNDNSLYRDILLESGIRAHTHLQGLENISMKSAFRRIAHQLVYLARQFGEHRLSRVRIKVLLTHQDLADALCLTRETITINLRKMQDKRLIKVNRYIEIPDLEELEKAAYQ